MPEPGVVRTVLGDVAPAELGPTDVHEHLLMTTPLLPGEELADVGRSTAEAAALRAAGTSALVELTTLGLGRDLEGLAAISRASGLRIVAATGVHREAHHPPGDPLHDVDEGWLADRFVADLQGRDGPPAGVLKVGVGLWRISPFEARNIVAAGEAHRRSGAGVVCHLELGSAAVEVLEALGAAGVPPDRVTLAHADRNPDPGLHAELVAAGAYLGYDGWARPQYHPDSTLLHCLVAVAEAGGAERIVLGGDMARARSLRAYGGLPGLDYLPRRVVPRLRALGGDELVRLVLVENPARFLTVPAGAGG